MIQNKNKRHSIYVGMDCKDVKSEFQGNHKNRLYKKEHELGVMDFVKVSIGLLVISLAIGLPMVLVK